MFEDTGSGRRKAAAPGEPGEKQGNPVKKSGKIEK